MQTLGLPNLQGVYDATNGVPSIVLAAAQPFTLRDNAVPIGDVLVIEDSGGVDFFNVDPNELNYGVATNRAIEVNADPTGKGGIRYMPDGRTVTSTVSQAALQWDSSIISNIPGGAPFGNDDAPAMVAATGECRFDDPAFLFSTSLLFNQATTISANTGSPTLGPIYTMVHQPLIRSVSANAKTCSQMNAVRAQASIGPNTAGNLTQTSVAYFLSTITVDATVGTVSVTDCVYSLYAAPNLVAGGTVGTLSCIRLAAIPAAGITNLRGIDSAMSAGQFIRHTGTAPAQLGGALQLGLGTTFDWSLSRVAANLASLADGDSLRITTGRLYFGASGAGADFISSGAGNLQVTSTRLGFGVAPAGSNWAFALNATARTITLAGDYANCLNTAGGNHTVDAALSTLTQWTVNAPAATLGTGSVVDAANMLIQTAPSIGTNRSCLKVSGNPSGGTLNFAIWQSNTSGRVRIDGRLDINRPIALGAGGAATLGLTGGSGPTAAAQSKWVEVDVAGVPHWIPAWI